MGRRPTVLPWARTLVTAMLQTLFPGVSVLVTKRMGAVSGLMAFIDQLEASVGLPGSDVRGQGWVPQGLMWTEWPGESPCSLV